MFAQEYLELSAETILIIEQSHHDEYIEDMCNELKRLEIYQPEYEFYSACRLERILDEYYDRE